MALGAIDPGSNPGRPTQRYTIFYRRWQGYIAGWVYASIELYVGLMSLLNFFDVGVVYMDAMYLGNLFVGLLIIYGLVKPSVYRYCFRKDLEPQDR